jgi:hypothetical protein
LLARACRGVHVERASVVRVYAGLPAARAALRRAAVGALEPARRVVSTDRDGLGHLHVRNILALVPCSIGGEHGSGGSDSFVDAVDAVVAAVAVATVGQGRNPFSNLGRRPLKYLKPKIF